MSEWKEIPLSKTTKFIVDNRGRTAPTELAGIPLIATNCISNNNLYPIYENLRYVSIYTYESWFRSHPEPGDIILTLKGSQNGAVCLAPNPVKFVIAQDMVALRVDEDIIDRLFLFAALRSPDVQAQIKNLDVSGVIPHLKKSDFDKLILPYPDRRVQESIGQIYFSLSNKTDLLHRQNATLEKMAETLFRQWFVEEAKEEWKVGTLDDILTVKGGTTPSTSEPQYWNGTIHWTSPRDITNLNGIYLFDTERKITELGLSKISSGLLPKGTLLMSSRAPVGVLAFSEVPVAINQGYIAILDNKGYSKEFIYLWLKTNIEVVHSFSNGSTFMEISKSAFKTLEIQIPPKQSLVDFQIIIKPLFEKLKSNQTQIRTLTTLRDTLLPKLMSGEVRVI